MSTASKQVRAEATVFTDVLRTRAAAYFTDLTGQPVQVQLTKVDPRPAGTHFQFTVLGSARQHRVLIKVRSPLQKNVSEGAGSPEGGPPADPGSVAALEFRALSAIHDRFRRLDASRFGTVRPLDSLPDHGAVVMEFVAQPSLRSLFVRSSYLRSAQESARLEEAFHNTGAWLRHFHSAPPFVDATVRRASRAEFIDFIEQLVAFLAANLQGDGNSWRGIVSAAATLAHEALPERLPLGGGHGDFAMRNLLIGPGGRVTAVDTHGAWHTPIYEDIGCFLQSLHCNRVQVMTREAAIPRGRLVSYERAFLSGYFGDDVIPHAAVRLFEAQAALEKWSSLVASRARSRGRGTYLLRTAKLRVLSGSLRKILREKLLLTGGRVPPEPALHGR